MSRSGGEGRGRAGTARSARTARSGRRAFAALLLLTLLFPAAADADESFGLERPVAQTLLRLQEGWIQWVSSFYQGNAEEAAAQVAELGETLRLVGFERLPELSIGASVRAVESARQGNVQRAAWGVASAEALDPGRPETAFAASVQAWEAGETLRAALEHVKGYVRLFGVDLYAFLAWQNLLLGVLAVLLIAGAAFLLLALVVHGPRLWVALTRLFGRRLPAPLHHLAALVFLLWPLLLPGREIWVPLYLSILVWGLASLSERVVLIAVWLVVAVAPVVVDRQHEQVAMVLSPPSQALRALQEGRLYGGLFSDLETLETLLPESLAVREIDADLDRQLGQWETARDKYEQILESEPTNVNALISLGAYFYRKGDYGSAIRYFQQATLAGEETAAAWFNLSQAFSESYLFDEQKQALAEARRIDDQRVDGWIRQGSEDRIINLAGGVGRIDEIQGELAASWEPWQRDGRGPGRILSLAVPFVALALALAFRNAVQRMDAPADSPALVEGFGWPRRLLRVAVPGLSAIEEGHGGRAFGSLVLLVAFLVLLLRTSAGYPIPWGLDPGQALPATLGATGLVVFFAVRLLLEHRAAS